MHDHESRAKRGQLSGPSVLFTALLPSHAVGRVELAVEDVVDVCHAEREHLRRVVHVLLVVGRCGREYGVDVRLDRYRKVPAWRASDSRAFRL